MGKTLYLLREETNQETFKTKAKYLFTSELNRYLVLILEMRGYDFMYLCNKEGLIHPEDEIEPYPTKSMPFKTKRVWMLFMSEYINRYCMEHGYNTIVFMFSGDHLKELELKLKYYGYKIEQPLKFFRTMDLKMRWVLSEYDKSVSERISRSRLGKDK